MNRNRKIIVKYLNLVFKDCNVEKGVIEKYEKIIYESIVEKYSCPTHTISGKCKKPISKKKLAIKLDKEYPKICYNLLGYFDKVKNDPERLNKLLDEINRNIYYWENSVYNDQYVYNKKMHEYENETPEIIEGAFTCKNNKCKSKRCYSMRLQTRSSDEGMTQFVICCACKNRFRVG
jgi:DNA-directed RNA polymerase subunit M/transcription elongation factor TFIIS